jgi:hypothetical protein
MLEPSSRATLLALVPLLVALATDVWLYADAKAHAKRGEPVVTQLGAFIIDSPEAWFIGSLLLWIVVVPLYIANRNQRR